MVSHYDIYINTIIYNNFLGFSCGQCLHPVDRVVLSPFRTETSFLSSFLRVAHLEPKCALPY